MRTVDREDLRLFARDAAHPAGDFGSIAVPSLLERIYVLGQPRLIFRIVSQRAERYPVEPGETTGGRQYVSDNRYCEQRNSYCVNSYSQPKQKMPPCGLFSVVSHC